MLRRILFCSCLIAVSAHAEDAALKKTQELLRDPATRAKAIEAGGAEAKAADARIGESLPGVDPNALYSVSADVLGTLTKKAQSDPAALEKIMGDLQRDPAALEKLLGPEELAKIRELAGKVQPPMKAP